ncbi:MAG: hypothetical protein QGD92_05180 [Gammaproteobacteria bacterium]|nr:hypothetical protein [Gammaproteobacteria bacterium]
MTYFIAFIGVLLCLIASVIFLFPRTVVELTQNLTVTTPLRLTAFGLRIALGILLVLAADLTRLPLVIEIIGYLVILGGIAVLLMSNRMLQSLIDWFVGWNLIAFRVAGIFAFLFGGFLIWACI